jgi:subtilisin family serine protease
MKVLVLMLCAVLVSCSSLPETPSTTRQNAPTSRASLVSTALTQRVLALIPCIENGMDPAYLVHGTPFVITDYFGDLFSLNRRDLGGSQLPDPWCLITLESNLSTASDALTRATQTLTKDFGQPPYAIASEVQAFTNDPGAASFDANCTQLPTLQKEASVSTPIPVSGLRQTLGVKANLTGRGMTVVVIDGGSDESSSLSILSRQFLSPEYPYLSGTANDVRDNFDCAETPYFDGHGKLVTGIIRNLAPDAQILMLKACNKLGVCTISSVAKALLYLRNRYAGLPTIDVVNMSFGGLAKTGDPISAAIISNMRDTQPNTLFVASVGNARDATGHFPAELNRVNNSLLSVAAAKLNAGNWELASFNTASVLNAAGIAPFGAPGVNLIINDGYGTRSVTGTSFATPVVSALALLERQNNPSALRLGSSLLQKLRDAALNVNNSFKLARY